MRQQTTEKGERIMENGKRIVIYLRCSSEEQAASGLGLEAQERKARLYVDANDLQLFEVISDPGFSGKSLQRPGIQRILELAGKRAIDAVIILRLDRLSRSVRDTLGIVELFKKHHVELHSLNEKLDTGTASGKFVLTLLSALAEMERGLISERTSVALQSKILRGERAGQIPFGWRVAEDGKTLIENQKEQGAIRLIRALHEQGHTYRHISRELTDRGTLGRSWHHQTISNVLRKAA
jgi:DNA invertase Pin-like site-specific DNA recombinase